MGEAVAIVAVSASAVVTVTVTVFGGSRERRWQAREERATELRTVLENGSECFGSAMFVAAEAYNEIKANGKLSSERQAELAEVEKRIVIAGNHIGVRRGSQSSEYATFLDCMTKIVAVVHIIHEADRGGLDSEREASYYRAQSEALKAERAYIDVAAKLLSV
jgi:hypothetical protein